MCQWHDKVPRCNMTKMMIGIKWPMLKHHVEVDLDGCGKVHQASITSDNHCYLMVRRCAIFNSYGAMGAIDLQSIVIGPT